MTIICMFGDLLWIWITTYFIIVDIRSLDNQHCLHQNDMTKRSAIVFHFLYILKLPSLFTAWYFWTFHNKSHNMKALVILHHSWSPFLPLTCLYGKNICGSLCSLLEYFLEKKLLPDYPCKSHDHGHQWAALVMAWLP